MFKDIKKIKNISLFTLFTIGGLLFFYENVFAQMRVEDINSWRAFGRECTTVDEVETCKEVATDNCQVELYGTKGLIHRRCHGHISTGSGIETNSRIDAGLGCVLISRVPVQKSPSLPNLGDTPVLYLEKEDIEECNDGLNVDWPVFLGGGNNPICLNKESTLEDLVRYLYTLIIALAGIATFGSFVFAGFQYTTSAGNTNKMSAAKERMTSSTIGLIFVLTSYIILNTINPQLTVFPSLELEKREDRNRTEIPDFEVSNSPCERIEFYNKNNFGYNADGKIVPNTRCVSVPVGVNSTAEPEMHVTDFSGASACKSNESYSLNPPIITEGNLQEAINKAIIQIYQ